MTDWREATRIAPDGIESGAFLHRLLRVLMALSLSPSDEHVVGGADYRFSLDREGDPQGLSAWPSGGVGFRCLGPCLTDRKSFLILAFERRCISFRAGIWFYKYSGKMSNNLMT